MENKIKKLIKSVLDKGYLMSLATVDESGVWVSDVIYVFDDDLNMYWISDPKTRHSKAIAKNSNIAGTVTVSNQGENNLGIQFSGMAKKLKGVNLNLAVKHFRKRKKSIPKTAKDVLNFLEGDSWYILKPLKIELICEELFGFDKKIFEL